MNGRETRLFAGLLFYGVGLVSPSLRVPPHTTGQLVLAGVLLGVGALLIAGALAARAQRGSNGDSD